MARVAVIQEPPVFLDRKATISRAVALIGKAAQQGADLAVFSETFISGYPAWIWRLRPGSDRGLCEELHARLLGGAVDLGTDQLHPIRDAARKHRVTVVCGMNEVDADTSRTTVYNTCVVIGPDGGLLNRHRKLMPTNPERMVHGFGDASGLKVVETPAGRLGTLICWENYMPLARYALYSLGTEVHVAPTYDSTDDWTATLQHIAREGGCWVIGAGHVLRAADLPADLPGRERIYPDRQAWVNPGGSVIVAPGGEICRGPAEPGVRPADCRYRVAAGCGRAAQP